MSLITNRMVLVLSPPDSAGNKDDPKFPCRTMQISFELSKDEHATIKEQLQFNQIDGGSYIVGSWSS